jgi:site-specific recombinase XerD
MTDPSALQTYNVEDGIAAAQTRQRYRSAFASFLKHSKIIVSHPLLQQPPRIIEAQIIDYVKFLAEEKCYTRGSINVAISAIFHFFEMNDAILNKRKVKRFMPSDETDHAADRSYTHEEIEQMLLKCDERSRVVILLMVSTGTRIGAVNTLQIGHILKIPEHGLYKIIVYAKSPKDRYYTFCTPECAAAIGSYLAYRKRFGDPLKNTSPLIREQFDIYDKFAAAYPKPLTYRAIIYIVEEVLKRSGLKTKKSCDHMASASYMLR